MQLINMSYIQLFLLKKSMDEKFNLNIYIKININKLFYLNKKIIKNCLILIFFFFFKKKSIAISIYFYKLLIIIIIIIVKIIIMF